FKEGLAFMLGLDGDGALSRAVGGAAGALEVEVIPLVGAIPQRQRLAGPELVGRGGEVVTGTDRPGGSLDGRRREQRSGQCEQRKGTPDGWYHSRVSSSGLPVQGPSCMHCHRGGVQPAVTEKSPFSKQPRCIDATMSLPNLEGAMLILHVTGCKFF